MPGCLLSPLLTPGSPASAPFHELASLPGAPLPLFLLGQFLLKLPSVSEDPYRIPSGNSTRWTGAPFELWRPPGPPPLWCSDTLGLAPRGKGMAGGGGPRCGFHACWSRVLGTKLGGKEHMGLTLPCSFISPLPSSLWRRQAPDFPATVVPTTLCLPSTPTVFMNPTKSSPV
jgi:hypothetical protein